MSEEPNIVLVHGAGQKTLRIDVGSYPANGMWILEHDRPEYIYKIVRLN